MSAALQGEHQQFGDIDYSSPDAALRYTRSGVRRGTGPRPTMRPVGIFHAAPLWMYAFLFRLFSLVSLLLERTLSQLHSLVHQTARITKPAAADADHATASKQQKQRAWWNVRKGSAIVLWSSPSCMSSVAGELSTWDLVHRLALALASIEKRAEGAGRAPYTVIVVVPSAQRGLAPLISDWAKTKADIEMMRKGNTSPPTGPATSARSKSGWFLRFLGEADDASPERSSESPLSAAVDVEPPAEEKGRPRRESAASSSNASSSSSGSKTPKKQRRPSGGRWTASDVVGLGMDMLKGLRVGQDLFEDANFGGGGFGVRGDARQDQRTTSRIGAVIPVVADTSTAAGLAHARSTIQAYCTSHDLLLRGLVVVPFVMGPPSQSVAVALGDEAAAAGDAAADASAGTSPSTSNLPTPKFGSNWSSQLASGLSPMTKTRTTASLSRASVRRTKQALDSDVVETLNMISALLPALVSDGGRVIGIMPTRWNVVPDESLEGVSGGPGTRDDEEVLDAGMAYQVAHNALTAMWQSISVELTAMGLRSCQVHMAPIRRRRRRRSIDVHSELKHGEALTGHFVRWLAKRFATTCFALLHPTLVEADATASPAEDAKEDSFDKTRKRTQKGTFSTLFSTQPLDSSTCPPLLIDAVRSSLVRSCPREKYCVGLGPRVQETILYLTPPVFRNLASRVVLNRFLTS